MVLPSVHTFRHVDTPDERDIAFQRDTNHISISARPCSRSATHPSQLLEQIFSARREAITDNKIHIRTVQTRATTARSRYEDVWMKARPGTRSVWLCKDSGIVELLLLSSEPLIKTRSPAKFSSSSHLLKDVDLQPG
jgi:hypothetical protein